MKLGCGPFHLIPPCHPSLWGHVRQAFHALHYTCTFFTWTIHPSAELHHHPDCIHLLNYIYTSISWTTSIDQRNYIHHWNYIHQSPELHPPPELHPSSELHPSPELPTHSFHKSLDRKSLQNHRNSLYIFSYIFCCFYKVIGCVLIIISHILL